MATWLVMEGERDTYDIERNGRAFAYLVDGLAQARARITKSRRYDKATDKIILVRADGGRETLARTGQY